jgi:hypothetical protein
MKQRRGKIAQQQLLLHEFNYNKRSLGQLEKAIKRSPP